VLVGRASRRAGPGFSFTAQQESYRVIFSWRVIRDGRHLPSRMNCGGDKEEGQVEIIGRRLPRPGAAPFAFLSALVGRASRRAGPGFSFTAGALLRPIFLARDSGWQTPAQPHELW
jgi:hypothetical protein